MYLHFFWFLDCSSLIKTSFSSLPSPPAGEGGKRYEIGLPTSAAVPDSQIGTDLPRQGEGAGGVTLAAFCQWRDSRRPGRPQSQNLGGVGGPGGGEGLPSPAPPENHIPCDEPFLFCCCGRFFSDSGGSISGVGG